MNRHLFSVCLLSLLLTVAVACPPDDDDDNDDATPVDDDAIDDDEFDDDASDDDTTDDDTADDDTTDDDTIDDDTVDDDTTDDDTADDDTADDDTVDDDTSDDDTADDDTADDDSGDDDSGDDDTIDDDTGDDDTGDDDIVVEETEYIFGGVAWPFDLAGSDEGPMYASAQVGGRPCLFTLGDELVTELLPPTLKPFDVQVDPSGNVHLLATEQGYSEVEHLWREDNVWYTEFIPDSASGSISDMAIDDAGHIHLCQAGYDTYYVTNASGQWVRHYIHSSWLEPTAFCRIFVAPDGAAHLTYEDTWYDWQGRPFHNLFWTTNHGGQWHSRQMTDVGVLQYGFMSFDDQGGADLVYATNDGLMYGYWDGDSWSLETVPDVTTDYYGIWRFAGKPTILLQDPSTRTMLTAAREGDGWSIADLGVVTGHSFEAVPTAAGQWRFLYRTIPEYKLRYLSNLTGAWVDEMIFAGPFVDGPISYGVDDQGRRFLLTGTYDGWRRAVRDDDDWLIEEFDIGVESLTNAQVMTDNQGVTHLVGNSGASIVYADNREGVWQSEIVTDADWQSHAFNLRPDGEPVIVYRYDNRFRFLERTADGWTIEELPTTDAAKTWTYGIAGNADGDVFICYEVSYQDIIRCARRIEGQWTVETIDESADTVVGTRAMAIDADGAPHYIYSAYESKYPRSLRLAVFRDDAWEITDLADKYFYEAELVIDDDGVHHLVAYHSTSNESLVYGTDADDVWRFRTVATSVNLHLTTKPELLADGSVQLAFRRGSALWRAVVTPPLER